MNAHKTTPFIIAVFPQTKLYRLILSLCLLISFLASSAFSQEDQRQDALPAIPLYYQEHLVYRLDALVFYYRNRQFDMVYEMLSPAYREGMRNADGTHPSKEEWVKGQEEWRENVGNRGILDFKLVKAVLIENSWHKGLILQGCVQFEKSDDRYKYETHAFYEDGEWYFWDVVKGYSCVKCELEPCGDLQNPQ